MIIITLFIYLNPIGEALRDAPLNKARPKSLDCSKTRHLGSNRNITSRFSSMQVILYDTIYVCTGFFAQTNYACSWCLAKS